MASRVVFEDGQPDKNGYRRYRIRDAAAGDDFACLREVLTRRLAKRESDPLPDLLMVDGGKGQLGVAVAALRDAGVELDAIGISKERDGRGRRARVRRPGGLKAEQLHLPARKDAVLLAPSSAALLLLQRVRDESHRFAIEFQRNLRQRAHLTSILEEIGGIGPGKRRALLRELGSLRAVRDAIRRAARRASKASRPRMRSGSAPSSRRSMRVEAAGSPRPRIAPSPEAAVKRAPRTADPGVRGGVSDAPTPAARSRSRSPMLARRRAARAAGSQRDLHVDRRRRPLALHAGPAERAAPSTAAPRAERANADRDTEQGADLLERAGRAGAERRRAARRPRRRAGGGGARVHRIPVERAGTGMIVPVRINGRVVAPFMVDTGASYVLIPKAVADEAGVEVGPDARTMRFTTANGVVEQPIVTLDSVELRHALRPRTFPPRSRRACRSACSGSRS